MTTSNLPENELAEINVAEFAELKRKGADFFLLDVRTPEEYADYNLDGYLITLDELPHRLDEIPRNKPIIVHCHLGGRSAVATEFLQTRGFADVKNLVGGVEAWKKFNLTPNN